MEFLIFDHLLSSSRQAHDTASQTECPGLDNNQDQGSGIPMKNVLLDQDIYEHSEKVVLLFYLSFTFEICSDSSCCVFRDFFSTETKVSSSLSTFSNIKHNNQTQTITATSEQYFQKDQQVIIFKTIFIFILLFCSCKAINWNEQSYMCSYF